MPGELWLLCAAVMGALMILIWYFFLIPLRCPKCRDTELETKSERLDPDEETGDEETSTAPKPGAAAMYAMYEVHCRCKRCGCKWSYTEKRKQLR